jgi:hypothetical protein
MILKPIFQFKAVFQYNVSYNNGHLREEFDLRFIEKN